MWTQLCDAATELAELRLSIREEGDSMDEVRRALNCTPSSHTHTHTHTHMPTYLPTHTYTHKHTCHAYLPTYTYLHTHTYTFMYGNAHIYTSTHLHTRHTIKTLRVPALRTHTMRTQSSGTALASSPFFFPYPHLCSLCVWIISGHN
jgi:hypothetical protein